MNIPNGAQVLTLPVNNLRLDCGYKDPDYPYNYKHYGHDYTCPNDLDIDVVSGGTGRVVACGLDRGTLLNIAVIIYDNVYMPNLKITRSVVVRYFHMKKLYIKNGQTVTRGTKIGMSMGYKNYPQKSNTGLRHVHVEVDGDARTKYACWSPQVGSGCRYLVKGTDTTINPANVFVIGNGQKATGHSCDTYYDRKTDLKFAQL